MNQALLRARLNEGGGEGGIRTHVSGEPDHLISSQRRYDRFGTSPFDYLQLPMTLFYQFFNFLIGMLWQLGKIDEGCAINNSRRVCNRAAGVR